VGRFHIGGVQRNVEFLCPVLDGTTGGPGQRQHRKGGTAGQRQGPDERKGPEGTTERRESERSEPTGRRGLAKKNTGNNSRESKASTAVWCT